MKFSVRTAAQCVMFAWLLLVGLGASARAQADSEPQHDVQWWPDTQAAIRLNPRFSLVLFGTVRTGRNISAVTYRQIGGGVSWSINPQTTGTLQYRYVLSDPTERRHSKEQRVFADLTRRFALGQGFTLAARTRAELRRINGDLAGRFSQRLQFEHPLSLGEHRFTPYVAGETFFDTRTRTLNRNRTYLGARIPLDKHLTLDGFYGHQWDARAKPGFWHVIGTFLRFEF